MSIAASLAEKTALLEDLEPRISELCSSASIEDVLQDSKYRPPQQDKVGSDLESLSLHQLHAQFQEVEEAGKLLNDLWLIRALIQDIKVAFDPTGAADYVCDKHELQSNLDNLSKLYARLQRLSEVDLIIVPVLRAYYTDLRNQYTTKLKLILLLLYPDVDTPGEYIINEHIMVNDIDFSVSEFNALYQEFELYAAVNDISEALNAKKIMWEKEILKKLVTRKTYLELQQDGPTLTLRLTTAPPANQYLSLSYFRSFKAFVKFINATSNNNFKHSYSTSISNSLVETISENIKIFMDSKEQMTEELIETLDLISRSGWPMPIRNIFTAQDRLQENLHEIYLAWVTEKYIHEIRDVFTSPQFDTDLRNIVQMEEVIEHVEELPEPEHTAEPVQNEQAAQSDEEIDWDAGWGSDVEERKSRAESDNWDDWGDEDDWVDESEPVNAKPVNAKPTAPLPKAQNEVREQVRAETIKITTSAIPQKLSDILERFAQESQGSDARLLHDAILSLALVSYPPPLELFLLCNDLRFVRCADDYLLQSSIAEWKHYKRGLVNEVTEVISKIDFSNNEGTPMGDDDDDGIAAGTSSVSKVIQRLCSSQLASTNSYEFKELILQLLNLMNHLVLDMIVNSGEITEYQSDKFTRFLESLQATESEVLVKVGEDPKKLATYNKVRQAIFLISNHLTDIMDLFYEGELYEFTTEELIKVIKSVFIPSELRERCIGEIIEIRSS